MNNIFLTICAVPISIILSYFMVKYPDIKQKKNIAALRPCGKEQYVLLMGMIVTTLATTCFLVFLYEAEIIFSLKRILLSTFLWSIAYVDIKKHIIPNKSLLFLIFTRFLFLIVELIIQPENLKGQLISELIAGVGMIILLCAMRLIVNNGIGFGDVKLYSVIGLFLGINSSISVLFLSFVVSFFVSIIFLISKQKGRKDYLAFAPFILIGYVIAVIVFGA